MMEMMMPEKFTTLQQIKKLDEERAKLLESAKSDALARAKEAINELTALGHEVLRLAVAALSVASLLDEKKSIACPATRRCVSLSGSR